jgi:hypothetical protein
MTGRTGLSRIQECATAANTGYLKQGLLNVALSSDCNDCDVLSSAELQSVALVTKSLLVLEYLDSAEIRRLFTSIDLWTPLGTVH